MSLVFPVSKSASTLTEGRKQHTFDQSLMSISPTVVSMITRPRVGNDMVVELIRSRAD